MRGKKITSYWQKLKTHAYIMGKSIIMNMERSEKLYESLKMRGFSGKISFAPIKLKVIDIGILILFIFKLPNLGQGSGLCDACYQDKIQPHSNPPLLLNCAQLSADKV